MKPLATGHAERGISLIIVMLILVVVTIVGIGGAQIALLSERATRYDRDYLIASQAAEAALKDAEADISGKQNGVAFTPNRAATFTPGNGGPYVVGCNMVEATRGLCANTDNLQKPTWAAVDFTVVGNSAPTVEFGKYTGNAMLSGNGIESALLPRYIVEQIVDPSPGNDASANASPRPKMYRITAMGFGPRPEVQVVMQSVYRKQ